MVINKMKKNVGCMEKNLRIILGVAILGVGYYYKSYWGLLGIVPILTAIISWCPLKVLFGFKPSCSSDDNNGSQCGLNSKKK